MAKTKSLNKTKINVVLDVLLALIFVVEMEQHFTGLPMHELLGLVFAGALIIHILLHLGWVVSITRSFFKALVHESRVNYVLNLALLIDLSIIAVTGIGISRTLGLSLDVDHSWESIHMIAAELSLVLIGLHVAMHWKWIATNVGKYLIPRVNFSRLKFNRQQVPTVIFVEVKNGTAS